MEQSPPKKKKEQNFDSVFLVGTVSNVSKNLESDLQVVLSALKSFKNIRVFLVESDSTDTTVELLEKLSEKIPDFSFVSLGNLKSIYPDRIERLRYCRNRYVEYIRSYQCDNKTKFVCIADLDGMNSKLKSDQIFKSLEREELWDACFSNQRQGYSDLFALRCLGWVDFDIFEKLEEVRKNYRKTYVQLCNRFPKLTKWLIEDFSRKEVIYRNMRKLNPNFGWIEVESAFGGFGIYKKSCFLLADYGEPYGLNIRGSEHLVFNYKIRESGGKLYINPALINANWNTYNLNRFFIIRQLREFMRKSSVLTLIRNKLRGKLQVP